MVPTRILLSGSENIPFVLVLITSVSGSNRKSQAVSVDVAISSADSKQT